MNVNQLNDIDADEEDDIGVPAGTIRVVLGLLTMVVGVSIAAFSENAYGDGLGLLLFVISPFIMITSKKNKG